MSDNDFYKLAGSLIDAFIGEFDKLCEVGKRDFGEELCMIVKAINEELEE